VGLLSGPTWGSLSAPQISNWIKEADSWLLRENEGKKEGMEKKERKGKEGAKTSPKINPSL